MVRIHFIDEAEIVVVELVKGKSLFWQLVLEEFVEHFLAQFHCKPPLIVLNENEVETINRTMVKNLSPDGQMKNKVGGERILQRSRNPHGGTALALGENFVEGGE